jgi:GDP/UDP-N,N'-diacetylbacillosamine 2-epimerase (hydrolysing)
MTRRICYITGTRADFGLMRSTLQGIHSAPGLELAIVATGMHLAPQYGATIGDIEAAGLPIAARVPVDLEPTTGATMARNIGHMLAAFVDALLQIRPSAVLLLGDRGEMLAGALAAIHLNIPVVHLHGGERSGTVDESVRHAISKLAHYHLVATEAARQRLMAMGELPAHVITTGAPGLDGIESLATIGREQLLRDEQLDPSQPVALLIYHPVLQEAGSGGAEIAAIIAVLLRCGLQVLALEPNSDAGGSEIREALRQRADTKGLRVITHLPRERFVSWMAAADLMAGNSSAGIIEAASFGTPVVNIGSRQNLRERNANVIDTPVAATAIEEAVLRGLRHGRYDRRNIYGDGNAGRRIVAFLGDMSLDPSILVKGHAY